jgi:hypothetical protein
VRAREGLMDFYAEQILVIAFDETGDIIIDQDGSGGRSRAVANHAKVQRDRLKVDSLKWTASRLFPKRYGDKMELLGQDNEKVEELVFRWETNDVVPPVVGPPPKQLQYHQPQLPADLSTEDWSALLRLLEVVRNTIPSNSDTPPQEIFEICRKALLEHFRETV